ncbi:solute e2 carrier family 35 member, partial [Mytilus galloprovincialis]
LLIWISILLFGNPMTFLSGLGTVIVTIGVLLYTKAKEVDHNRRELIQTYPRLGETKDKYLLLDLNKRVISKMVKIRIICKCCYR